MKDFDDTDTPDAGRSERTFSYSSRRHRTRRPPLWAAWVVVLVVGVTIGWLALRSGGEPEPGAPSTLSAAPEPVAAPPDPDVPPLDLPDLAASDAFVRDLVARLSSHPRLAAWLVSDELVHRFVTSVVRVSGGMSPASDLEDLGPEGEFAVRESGERLLIDPASYRRYDLLAETFASLDVRGTAQLYHQLHPLFVEAYAALGIPNLTFDEAVARSVRNLLDVDVRAMQHEVVEEDGVFVFADPRMEARSSAEKHLIRMGPENARLVQVKLRELAEAIGIPVTIRR